MSYVKTAFLAALILSSGVSVAQSAEANTLTPAELNDGWILLFDGESTYGWTAGSQANWKASGGVISVSEGEPGLLCTNSDFDNYVFKCDFRCPNGTNSGVFLRTPMKPKDPKSDCYELNIADDTASPFYTGSFVGRQKATEPWPNGEWQSFEATCDGGRFTVKLDGKLVLEYSDPAPVPRGKIGLQLNKGPVEFKNVKLKPLGLKGLFNGKDLAGWKVFPDLPSVFSVTPEGWLNVKNGKGQLETEQQFADFTLQLECISNGKQLNSGLFLRSIPGEYQNGYESQIQNGYKDGDRTKPVDGGTGGIYRRQPARKVVSDDFQWFHKTIVASGPHLATWVNGYQIADWTDTRPPHDNPRNGLKLGKGTIIIQGHDPTTDLSFRNLRAAEMGKRP